MRCQNTKIAYNKPNTKLHRVKVLKKVKDMTAQEQRKYIADNYLSLPAKTIARNIQRSNCYVRTEMKRQGLVVPLEIIKKFKKESRFKKGHVSWNKGMKQSEFLSNEAIEKSKATRFKKGHMPHNTKHDYCISLRKDTNGYQYYYIRIALAKWVQLHRFLWEMINGEIPKGCNIQFKDGNSTNCTLENLYIVNRKTQARQNILGGKKLPFELRNTIELILKLKNKTYEKQNQRSQ